ncbi:MAG: zinc ribbon domain-containing protein [Candidatus Bruticola sp.]
MSDNMGYIPPTVSPVCNMILDRMEHTHAGDFEFQSLALIVVEQLAIVDRTKKEVIAKLEEGGSECLSVSPEIVSEIKAALEDYSAGLRDLLTYIETKSEDMFRQAYDTILSVGINGRLLFEGYTREEGEMGPTNMPMINVLVRLCDGFVQEAVSKAAIERTIVNIYVNARVAANDVTANEEASDYQKESLMSAYCDFADTVLDLRQVLDNGPEAMQPYIEDIVSAGASLRQSVESLTMALATKGDSKLPQVNLIINLAKSWKNGRIDKESFLRALDQFRSSVDDLRREIESLAAIPNDCKQIGEQMVICRAAFEDHFKAIAMFEAVAEGQEADFDEAVALLIKAADALYASKESFDSIGEQAEKVPCVHCGAYNDPANRSCSNCGARMLSSTIGGSMQNSTMEFQENSGQMQYGGELIMTKNLVTVFESVNKIAEGRITGEEYGEVLDWFCNLIEDNLINLPPEPELDGSGLNDEELEQLHVIENQIANSRAEIDNGAKSMLDAVERLRLFITDNNSLNLVEGVRELRDASIRVQRGAREIDELVRVCREQAGLPAEDYTEEEEEQ